MLYALIVLALIPFALIGACIAIRLAWALVPYAAAGMAGLVTVILMEGTPQQRNVAWVGVLATLMALVWIVQRWTGPRSRR
jgi:hypothetical protein